jgi:hypothetical protein
MPTQSLHCIILYAMIRISTINRYSYINMAKSCTHLIYYYAFYSLHRVVLCRCDWYMSRLIIGCGINIFYLFYLFYFSPEIEMNYKRCNQIKFQYFLKQSVAARIFI